MSTENEMKDILKLLKRVYENETSSKPEKKLKEYIDPITLDFESKDNIQKTSYYIPYNDTDEFIKFCYNVVKDIVQIDENILKPFWVIKEGIGKTKEYVPFATLFLWYNILTGKSEYKKYFFEMIGVSKNKIYKFINREYKKYSNQEILSVDNIKEMKNKLKDIEIDVKEDKEYNPDNDFINAAFLLYITSVKNVNLYKCLFGYYECSKVMIDKGNYDDILSLIKYNIPVIYENNNYKVKSQYWETSVYKLKNIIEKKTNEEVLKILQVFDTIHDFGKSRNEWHPDMFEKYCFTGNTKNINLKNVKKEKFVNSVKVGLCSSENEDHLSDVGLLLLNKCFELEKFRLDSTKPYNFLISNSFKNIYSYFSIKALGDMMQIKEALDTEIIFFTSDSIQFIMGVCMAYGSEKGSDVYKPMPSSILYTNCKNPIGEIPEIEHVSETEYEKRNQSVKKPQLIDILVSFLNRLLDETIFYNFMFNSNWEVVFLNYLYKLQVNLGGISGKSYICKIKKHEIKLGDKFRTRDVIEKTLYTEYKSILKKNYKKLVTSMFDGCYNTSQTKVEEIDITPFKSKKRKKEDFLERKLKIKNPVGTEFIYTINYMVDDDGNYIVTLNRTYNDTDYLMIDNIRGEQEQLSFPPSFPPRKKIKMK